MTENNETFELELDEDKNYIVYEQPTVGEVAKQAAVSVGVTFGLYAAGYLLYAGGSAAVNAVKDWRLRRQLAKEEKNSDVIIVEETTETED